MTLEENIENYIKKLNEIWPEEYLLKKQEERKQQKREYFKLYQRKNYEENFKSLVRRKWPESAKGRKRLKT